MAKPNTDMQTDVEQLVSDLKTEQAVEQVWLRLEAALAALPEESAHLLRLHLEGKTRDQLSAQFGLGPVEVENLLNHAKQSLKNSLKNQTPMKN